jgi:hypothetical protein
MAARRRRRWIAIGGATAAVAAGVWAAVALGAPTGLVISTSVTHLPPHLSWSDDGAGAAATGYSVERSSGGCTSFQAAGGTGAGATTFDDSPPSSGTWCYHVIGHYAGAADATSGTASVLYDATPPAVQLTSPLNLTFVHGTVTIQANASDVPSGIASLRVSVDGLIAPAAPPLTWDTNVVGTNGQTYIVRADAVDNAGNTATTTASVTIDNTPPAAPVVSATPTVTGSPLLSWATVAGEAYTVARTSATGPGPKTFASSAAGTWSDPDTLPPGTYTYVVTATDLASNSTPSAPVTVVVISPGVTAPRALSANSPSRSVPHLTWQTPVTFAVTSWEVYRDGAPLQAVADPSATSFDDTSASQGSHTYAVQALSGAMPGDMSGPVAVTYDSVPPVLDPVTATANPTGSVSITWPAASDPAPGSGVSSYIVRRGAGSSAPADTGAGTGVCTLAAPETGCIDTNAKSGTLYGYAVFAVDAAGNLARREAVAKPLDTQPPDAVTGLKVVSSDRTYVRLGWTAPSLKGADADLAGYRVLMLRAGATAPLNPGDGTVICRNEDPQDTICDSLNLATGKKVTYAVYAYDEVPNYSPPALISAVPRSIDRKPPHRPTKVRLTHAGLEYTLTWVSPRDPDLSKFRVTLLPTRPSPRPAVGKAVVTGRVLHATFTLAAGQKVYVNLFALDVSGNFSRVTKYVVVPAIATRSKHKVVKQEPKTTTPTKTVQKKAKPGKPVAVTIQKA